MSVETVGETGSTAVIRTSFSHRGLALVGAALVAFEILFVFLLASPFWFDLNLVPLGVPTVALMALIAHCVLVTVESEPVCRMLRFLLNGKPPLVYQKWIWFDEKGFTYGVKRVRWDVIDEVALNFFGTLLVKSRDLCGPANVINGKDLNPADVIVKLPFSAIAFSSQHQFVDLLGKKKPDVVLNERLKKQINQPLIKGMQYVQGASVVFLSLALLDLGYATFTYLETLKEYYLCQVDAIANQSSTALEHFLKAEDLRLHPLPISYITTKLTSLGGVSENYQQARWEALWEMGRHEDALKVAKDVADKSPKGFRSHLRVARLYSQLNDQANVKEQIDKAIEKRDDALLPRMYQVAFFLAQNDLAKAKKSFDDYSTKLDDEVFGKQPSWPPGDIHYVDSVWYKGDLHYIFSRVLKNQTK